MDKSIFAPLLKIHDKDGEFQTLLQANGFQVDAGQTELLLSQARWFRMNKNGEKIPPLTIGNINKFRDEHIGFLKGEMQRRQLEATLKPQAGAPLEVVKE